MITDAQQYQVTKRRLEEFRAGLARMEREGPGDDPIARARRAAIASQIETFEREIGMWDAGIREPIPGNPDLPVPPSDPAPTRRMSQEELHAASREAAMLLKRAEIANIDRQIGILLDRIADWRRHRAWLEREIGELEAQGRTPATVA